MYLNTIACERCSHYISDGRWCEYWGTSDPWIDEAHNKILGCEEFDGPSLDDYIKDIVVSLGGYLGKDNLISMVKELVPDALNVCKDLCKGTPGQCEQCHRRG